MSEQPKAKMTAKDILKPALILVIFTALAAVILAVANHFLYVPPVDKATEFLAKAASADSYTVVEDIYNADEYGVTNVWLCVGGEDDGVIIVRTVGTAGQYGSFAFLVSFNKDSDTIKTVVYIDPETVNNGGIIVDPITEDNLAWLAAQLATKKPSTAEFEQATGATAKITIAGMINALSGANDYYQANKGVLKGTEKPVEDDATAETKTVRGIFGYPTTDTTIKNGDYEKLEVGTGYTVYVLKADKSIGVRHAGKIPPFVSEDMSEGEQTATLTIVFDKDGAITRAVASVPYENVVTTMTSFVGKNATEVQPRSDTADQWAANPGQENSTGATYSSHAVWNIAADICQKYVAEIKDAAAAI
ncbi:MAG: hypothetical protein LBM78_00665 [Clostridiales bacterium]|jgi:Na+-translocating ferredoxin:NAD+ oxidoreductase RnfG subunit|nr:hypothetical protein [Clostridiales bacterium]